MGLTHSLPQHVLPEVKVVWDLPVSSLSVTPQEPAAVAARAEPSLGGAAAAPAPASTSTSSALSDTFDSYASFSIVGGVPAIVIRSGIFSAVLTPLNG